MLSTSCCAHCLNCLGFVYLFMRHCASPLSSSPSFLLFLFWLKIVLDYFNTFSLYPVGSQFQVERITSVNAFPFGTKLQSHSPVKGGLDKKIVSSTLPHLKTHLHLIPHLHFPLVFSPLLPPRLIPCRLLFLFSDRDYFDIQWG